MKVIVAGSRSFSDYNTLEKELNNLEFEITTIISGTAHGADRLGEVYASEYNIPVDRYPADWNQYGKSAGYIRNVEMAKEADALVAFWDGTSKGTFHMINIARKKGLKVIVVRI